MIRKHKVFKSVFSLWSENLLSLSLVTSVFFSMAEKAINYRVTYTTVAWSKDGDYLMRVYLILFPPKMYIDFGSISFAFLYQEKT